ncbi:hypothetical protein SNEBB_000889 [Seison nebaliae]|nr:hypothetical protein SNEBB_000889 [Seison nebaliae]
MISQIINESYLENKKKLSRLIVTSDSNLSELYSLINKNILNDDFKSIIYFHENQLIFPTNKLQERDIQYSYNQIISCLVADKILFNSHFNRSSFIENISRFINKFPSTCRPKNTNEIIKKIEEHSSIFYIPIKIPKEMSLLNLGKSEKEFHIIWAHRWEHDKNPESLYHILELCKSKMGDDVRLLRFHVIGKSFSQIPKIFEDMKKHFPDLIDTFGFLEEKNDYYRLLKTSHCVLSTSNHEFFGISMMESVLLGLLPLCPNRLVYPELYPKIALYNTEKQIVKRLICYGKNRLTGKCADQIKLPGFGEQVPMLMSNEANCDEEEDFSILFGPEMDSKIVDTLYLEKNIARLVVDCPFFFISSGRKLVGKWEKWVDSYGRLETLLEFEIYHNSIRYMTPQRKMENFELDESNCQRGNCRITFHSPSIPNDNLLICRIFDKKDLIRGNIFHVKQESHDEVYCSKASHGDLCAFESGGNYRPGYSHHFVCSYCNPSLLLGEKSDYYRRIFWNKLNNDKNVEKSVTHFDREYRKDHFDSVKECAEKIIYVITFVLCIILVLVMGLIVRNVLELKGGKRSRKHPFINWLKHKNDLKPEDQRLSSVIRKDKAGKFVRSARSPQTVRSHAQAFQDDLAKNRISLSAIFGSDKLGRSSRLSKESKKTVKIPEPLRLSILFNQSKTFRSSFSQTMLPLVSKSFNCFNFDVMFNIRIDKSP